MQAPLHRLADRKTSTGENCYRSSTVRRRVKLHHQHTGEVFVKHNRFIPGSLLLTARTPRATGHPEVLTLSKSRTVVFYG